MHRRAAVADRVSAVTRTCQRHMGTKGAEPGLRHPAHGRLKLDALASWELRRPAITPPWSRTRTPSPQPASRSGQKPQILQPGFSESDSLPNSFSRESLSTGSRGTLG